MMLRNGQLSGWLALMLMLFNNNQLFVSANFLREGFSSSIDSDFKGEMKLEDNESALGMTREMFLMKDVEWELNPISFSEVSNGKLRRHLQKFFSDPVQLKLSPRKGKHGLRAMGQLKSGKRLRAFWRPGVTAGLGGGGGSTGGASSRAKGPNFMKDSYDDAIRARLSMLEFELQLPPVDKKHKKKLPSVIVSVAVEPGTMNPKSIVPRGAARVRVLPEGRSSDGTPVEPVEVGKTHVTLPMKAGLVDPSWARGRAVYRKGRSCGTV